MMERKHIQHLYWRAGFGIHPRDLQLLEGKSREEIIDQLFSESKAVYPLQIDLSEFRGLDFEMLKRYPKQLRDLIIKSNERIKEFNYAWLQRMINPRTALRERMTVFWATHFVCRDNDIRFVQQYNNTLRSYALGNFGDFTKAISKEPAMLKYLNNKQNIKKSPNENFTRELMELFTLGAGHYTEKDIKQGARAFTGYFHDFNGRFVFRFRQHDTGKKHFLGFHGRFNGDDVIKIILSKQQCARFICEKIYAYFVNENIVEEHIEEMAQSFYGNYDIEQLMRFVFSSDWFYEEKNIGNKIKSPVELLVGINRTVPVKFNDVKQCFYLQRYMGQILVDPPNVAGWKGGRNWINNNTLMYRLKLPSILLNGGLIPVIRKNQFFDPMNARHLSRGGSGKLDISVDWGVFEKRFDDIDIDHMPDFLMQAQLNHETSEMFNNLKRISKRSFALQLMSLPEYQMC